MIKILSALIVSSLIAFPAMATECYSEKFSRDDVVRALQDVLVHYPHIEFDETKKLPCVAVGSNVDKSLYMDTYGFVPKHVVNHYQWKQNVIVLMDSAGYDSLVHEMTHYVQYIYQGYSLGKSFDSDYLEEEAVRIQGEV